MIIDKMLKVAISITAGVTASGLAIGLPIGIAYSSNNEVIVEPDVPINPEIDQKPTPDPKPPVVGVIKVDVEPRIIQTSELHESDLDQFEEGINYQIDEGNIFILNNYFDMGKIDHENLNPNLINGLEFYKTKFDRHTTLTLMPKDGYEFSNTNNVTVTEIHSPNITLTVNEDGFSPATKIFKNGFNIDTSLSAVKKSTAAEFYYAISSFNEQEKRKELLFKVINPIQPITLPDGFDYMLDIQEPDQSLDTPHTGEGWVNLDLIITKRGTDATHNSNLTIKGFRNVNPDIQWGERVKNDKFKNYLLKPIYDEIQESYNLAKTKAGGRKIIIEVVNQEELNNIEKLLSMIELNSVGNSVFKATWKNANTMSTRIDIQLNFYAERDNSPELLIMLSHRENLDFTNGMTFIANSQSQENLMWLSTKKIKQILNK